MKKRGFIVYLLFLLTIAILNGQTPGTLKWEFLTNGSVASSPAIDNDGTIYVGSYDNNLYAINPDGTSKWNFLTNGDVSSSPAIGHDGTVYVGSDDNKLYAINPNGDKKWEFLTNGDISSSPAIGYDGTVYIASFDDTLYAINPDGTKKWTFYMGGDVNSSPAIGRDGTIYIGSYDDNLYAIQSNGIKKWEFSTGGNVYSSPAIGIDGTIYVGSLDDKLYAIQPDGIMKWEYLIGSDIYSSPAIGTNGTIYVGAADDKLYAISPDGTKEFEFLTEGNINCSPAIGDDGTIYVGSFDYKLYAIEQNGTLKWEYLTDNVVYSSPSIGTDGTVYMGISNTDKLYAIYSDCGGLASSPWPKFRKDESNSGYFVGLNLTSTFDVALLDSGSSIEVTIDIINNEDGDVSITDFMVADSIDYTISSIIPLTILSGNQGVIKFQINPDTTAYYRNKFEINYSVNSDTKTISSEAPIAVFIKDNSETAYIAEMAIDAYNSSKSNDAQVSLANNTGVIYRLLSEYNLAERFFENAIDSSLHKGYGFAGIKMNLGVVSSDLTLSTEADYMYDEAYADISSDESSSALAPQIYYNQAWEAYLQNDDILVSNKANLVLTHAMANDYLKAKAYTLLGAVESRDENYPDARVSFRSAIDMDTNGPVGQMAMENLTSICRPQIIEESDSEFLCEGDSIMLKVDVFGEAPYSFDWFQNENLIKSGTSTSDSIIIMDFNESKDGNYRCVVENEFGACTSSVFTLTTVIPEKPEITPAKDTSICEGEAVILTAPYATDYLWSNGAITRSIRATDSGSYSVIIEDEYGCASLHSDSVEINIYPLPEKPTISILGNILVSSSTFGNQWLFDNTIIVGEVEQEYTVPKDGNYFVIVTDEKGCSNRSEAVYISVTSIQSNTGNSIFSIYPNPNDGSFILRIGNGFRDEKIELRMYNTNGRMIMNKILYHQQDSNEFHINSPDLISGLYHLQIVIGEDIRNKAIIIQK